jgi:hypothetical protein
MIPVPTGVRVWLATGHTDMRRGFPGLSLQVQEVLRRDPLSGHLFVFRGRRGDLLKVIWPSERLSLTINVRFMGRGHVCLRNVWKRGVSYGPAQPMARFRYHRRSSVICFPGSTGVIPRKAGAQLRLDDIFSLEIPANHVSLAV